MMTKKILLVDDEEMITSSLKKILELKGYEVTTAHDGKEAVALSRMDHFDLLITDIRMPHLDGVSTVKTIREMLANAGKSGMPEILMTGHACDEYLQEAKGLKVADLLFKPIETYELLKSISNIIGEGTRPHASPENT